MDGVFAPWHLIVILVLFALLFGSKRLPESARALGQSLRIFKAEMRQAEAEQLPPSASQPPPPPPAVPPA